MFRIALTLPALLLALLTIIRPAHAAQQRETFAIALASGRVLEVEQRRPAALASQRLPAVLLFGGLRGTATILDAVPADTPAAIISFDYPLDLPRRFVFPDSFLHIPEVRRGINETNEGIRTLHAALQQREDIDPTRISIVGASLGAPFATIAAAELELAGLVIVHGFGDVRRVIAQQFIWKYGRGVRWPAHALAMLLTWGLRLPAPEDYARQLRGEQRVLMIVADDDDLIPRRATEVLWTALERSNAQLTRINESGVHLTGNRDPRIPALVGSALDWMRGVGLL